MVHCVVALHRIAKSVDHQQLRSSKGLTQQLAALAAAAAHAMHAETQVKEVSKALPGASEPRAVGKRRGKVRNHAKNQGKTRKNNGK